MAKETYKRAQTRILKDLAELGWTVKPELKVPQAIHPEHGYKLYFRPQAVYFNEHSLWLDIRGMTAQVLVAHAEAHRTSPITIALQADRA